MNIIVNGRSRDVAGPIVSYSQIVALAEEPLGATVTYRSRSGVVVRQGILTEGDTLFIDPGMTFNAIMTGNA